MEFDNRLKPGTRGNYLHESYSQWVRNALGLSRKSGDQAISLFDSSVPEPRELLRNVIETNFTPDFSKYYASAFGGGNPFVLERLAEQYGVARDQVLCTTGASAALSLLMRALAQPGDHILVETPGFDLFTTLAEDALLDVGYFRRSGDDYTIDVEVLDRAIRPNTRLVVLSNLHNPSGMALDHGVMKQIAALAERRAVHILVDEVYGDYASLEARPVAAHALSPNLISVSSLTKNFGLPAVRCGWIVASPDVMAIVRDLGSRVDFGVSNITHAIAAAIISDPEPFRTYSRDGVARSRPILDQWFDETRSEGLVAGRLPEAGCICFPELPGVADTRAFSDRLVAEHGIIVAPGEFFGQAGHIRVGFVQPEGHLEKGLEGLTKALRESSGTAPPRQFAR